MSIDDVNVLSLGGRGLRALALMTLRVRHLLNSLGGLSVWLHGRTGPTIEKVAALKKARLKLLLLHLLLVHLCFERLNHEFALLLQLFHTANDTVHLLGVVRNI